MKDHALGRFVRRSVPLLVWSLLLAGPVHGQQRWIVHDDLFSVAFPTETEGFASGRFGTILRSSDGGRTWARQMSGTVFTLSSVRFADSKNGWAVGNKGTILATRDGGQTWEKQESPVDYYHMDVCFVSPLKGFIVSERTHILATRDGGRTWQVRFSDEDYILKSVSFCDERNGWAAGEFGHTYHTADGGETWEKQAGYYEMDLETGFLRGDDFLFDVVAVDPLTAWAVGIEGTVRRTTDGGRTWETVETGAPKVQLYTIESDGKGGLVIGGKGVCLFSADRGSTWKAETFEPTIEYGWLYDIQAGKGGLWVACGDEGAIYRKTPEGSWRRAAY